MTHHSDRYISKQEKCNFIFTHPFSIF